MIIRAPVAAIASASLFSNVNAAQSDAKDSGGTSVYLYIQFALLLAFAFFGVTCFVGSCVRFFIARYVRPSLADGLESLWFPIGLCRDTAFLHPIPIPASAVAVNFEPPIDGVAQADGLPALTQNQIQAGGNLCGGCVLRAAKAAVFVAKLGP